MLRSRDVGPAVIGVGRPFLEQRIERMTERVSGMSRMQTALIVAGAVGVLAAAWALPQPVRAARVGGSVGAYCPIDTSKVAAKVLYGLDWTS